MAVVYESQGEYAKALKHYKRSLKIRLATVGDNDPSTARTYANMAGEYQSLGTYAKALEYYERSLKIMLATLGDNHPDTGALYYNMSRFFERKDRPLAKEYAIKARDICMSTLGREHPFIKSTQKQVAYCS
eukprot:UC1_evm1s913